ncbi:MAG: TetR/AcrR family transcriptional regulator [Firmicutes bacterium]|nr:TetR/AcrR family transcriptional regulator [Bacillota bacterium]
MKPLFNRDLTILNLYFGETLIRFFILTFFNNVVKLLCNKIDTYVDKRRGNLPKIVNYEQKKKDIINNALNIFIDNGYHNTSFGDVAKAGGMGRTTLYQYFKNKDEIFHYVIKHAIKLVKDELVSIEENKNLSSITKIKSIVHKLISRNYNNDDNNMLIILIDLWLILKREDNIIAEEIYQYGIELKDMFKELLIKGINNNEIKSVDTDAMAYVLWGIVESSLLRASIEKSFNKESYLESINILIEGLKK